jgi:O-antigen/teichoic acid export membrane protein
LVILTPLILTRFSAEDIVVWYVFASILSMQVVADMGFGTSFSRILSYAYGGATSLPSAGKTMEWASAKDPNWELIAVIRRAMQRIYQRVSLGFLVVMLGLGTWAVYHPIQESSTPERTWIAWLVILGASSVGLWGNQFSACMIGLDKIALQRRWEAVLSLLGLGLSIATVLLHGDLLVLILISQSWTLVNVALNRWLCRQVTKECPNPLRKEKPLSEVTTIVWSSAWRSGLGVAMSQGLIQVSGIMVAQLSSPGTAGSYLLAMRLVQSISQFSQAPFYSKLPRLASLYAQGEHAKLIRVAKNGMRLSYWVFATGCIGLGLVASWLLEKIGSNVDFVDPWFWVALCFAYYIERYGAMHIQLYSITNHIVWHVANMASGTIFLLFSIGAYPFLKDYAFPLGMLAGNLGFYSWFSAMYSYRTFDLTFKRFEWDTSLPPLLVMATCIIAVIAVYSTGWWLPLK